MYSISAWSRQVAIHAGEITLVKSVKFTLNIRRMDNKKPDEMARYIFNNCVYFCGNKLFAKECTLYIVTIISRLKLKIDDEIYWKLVHEEVYKIN
jgi:hypothetical protein